MWSKYPHVEVAAPITAFRILGSEIQKDEPHIDVIVLGFFIFFLCPHSSARFCDRFDVFFSTEKKKQKSQRQTSRAEKNAN